MKPLSTLSDKKVLIRLINNISFTFYMLFQSRDYMSEDKDYLQLDETMLLLNEEVDEYLKSLGGFDNSYFYIRY